MSDNKLQFIHWTVRVLTITILLFGLPFYFGYGNPLPFINPEYTSWDNMWLSVFPIMFIGLGIGIKNENLGGFMVIFSVGTGLLLGYFIAGELVSHMIVPLIVGILLLVDGYKDQKRKVIDKHE